MALVTLPLCLAVAAVGAWMWMDAPPPAPAEPRPHVSAGDAAQGLCALIGRPQGLDQRFVLAAADSGQLPQPLERLARQYASDSSTSARAQLMSECQRLGLPT
jgi:hypothetical protein